MNGIDYLLICAIAAAAGLAVRKIKNNKDISCDGHCNNCPARKRRNCGR